MAPASSCVQASLSLCLTGTWRQSGSPSFRPPAVAALRRQTRDRTQRGACNAQEQERVPCLREVTADRRELLKPALCASLWLLLQPDQALAATDTEEELQLVDFDDDESGFTIKIPKGWEMETPGQRNEFHAPKDYGGKRIIIKRDFLGKSKEVDLHLLGSVEEYAKKLAYMEGEGANTGTNAEVLSTRSSDDGRYYYIEYRINSFQSQRIWSVCGAGLGQSAGARKFKNRQLVTVSGKMAEDDLQKDLASGELLQELINSFHFTDKPLQE